ncbi:hypothetical protein ACQP1W_16670 [Spirillospora sp. CA-255316]
MQWASQSSSIAGGCAAGVGSRSARARMCAAMARRASAAPPRWAPAAAGRLRSRPNALVAAFAAWAIARAVPESRDPHGRRVDRSARS